jgi:hypothetical protein
MLCSVIKFDSRTGYLAEGVHCLTLADVARQFAWNARRRFLFEGFRRAHDSLASAGCRTILLDGSFVTAKETPGDWDAAFDPVGVIPERLDPILIKHDDGRRAMRAKYLGDIFPWSALAAGSDGPIFRQFFQKDRDGLPKGIIEIKLQVLQ